MPQRSAISNARAFFEKIAAESDAFAYLSSIPYPPRSEPFYETEWIDFKGYPHDDEDTKPIWSKALSGFANITEGLLIWGIDARKDRTPRKIDAAVGLRLIPDPHAFESKLRGWVTDATNPPVIGVEYLSSVGPNGGGFVVCLIPESSHKPHRQESADKYYYYRAGDSFLNAEPGLLRTLFFQHLNPYFNIEVQLRYEFDPPHFGEWYRKEATDNNYNRLVNARSTVQLDAYISNTGVATGKEVYIVADTDLNLDYHQGSDWKLGSDHLGRATFRALRSIHPEEYIRLFTATFPKTFPNTPARPPSQQVIPHFGQISMRFFVYAESFQSQAMLVHFTQDDLDPERAFASQMAEPDV